MAYCIFYNVLKPVAERWHYHGENAGAVVTGAHSVIRTREPDSLTISGRHRFSLHLPDGELVPHFWGQDMCDEIFVQSNDGGFYWWMQVATS